MNHQQKILNELWRADIYRLLALGFDTPSEKNLNNLDGLLSDLTTLESHPTLLKKLSKLREALQKGRRELTQEYNRLFIIQSTCPTSEGSYHLAERGPILGDITAFYKAFRINVASHSGPPDSIKMQLAFMHFMALKKTYALKHDLTEAWTVTEAAEKKFLRDHLGRWVVPFSDRLREATIHSFYTILGTLLTDWVKNECDAFDTHPTPLPTSLLPQENEGCPRCAVH